MIKRAGKEVEDEEKGVFYINESAAMVLICDVSPAITFVICDIGDLSIPALKLIY